MTKRTPPIPVATQRRYEVLAGLLMANPMNARVLTLLLAVALEQLDAGLYVDATGELAQRRRPKKRSTS